MKCPRDILVIIRIIFALNDIPIISIRIGEMIMIVKEKTN